MTVSIHQPNYLPWLGFFDKIKRSDVFVIFDNVQYPRGKGHFGNRNKIKIYNDSKWLTVPVEGKSEMKNINEIKYKDTNWKEEHLRLIDQFYRKSKYYKMFIEDFKVEFMKDFDNLSDFNTNLIKYFLYELDIETSVYKSSELIKEDVSGADRIMSILKECKATNKRYDAKLLGYTISVTIGTINYDNAIGCKACYWYAPKAFNQELVLKK